MQAALVRARREVVAAFAGLAAEAAGRLDEKPSSVELELEVAEAMDDGNRQAADLAIARWRREWLATLREARCA